MEQPSVWSVREQASHPQDPVLGSTPVKALVKEQQEWPRQGGHAPPAGVSWAMAVARGDRWAVWRRLQELGIPCTCRADRPLLVTVASPLAAWQVWHVVRMQGEPAPLRDWLERCYKVAL
ncbi:MAG: Asr1405/Asl0597 family protein [Pseudanabaenaceae cyanobacterium]